MEREAPAWRRTVHARQAHRRGGGGARVAGRRGGTTRHPSARSEGKSAQSFRARQGRGSIHPLTIQRSIEGDRELSAYDIKVAGNERRGITLSGKVPSERLRNRAERLAERASGAQHVHNDIIVSAVPDDRRGDDAATTDKSDPAKVMPQRE
jgi:hypothetical protein